MGSTAPIRLNIYLDDPELRTKVRVAAARRGMTISAYCVEAIRQRLAEDESRPAVEAPTEAAAELDEIRRHVGRIGIPVSELVAEGRHR